MTFEWFFLVLKMLWLRISSLFCRRIWMQNFEC